MCFCEQFPLPTSSIRGEYISVADKRLKLLLSQSAQLHKIIMPGNLPRAINDYRKYLESRKGAKSARSVGVVIENKTNRRLIRQQVDISHGEWTRECDPPLVIEPVADDKSPGLGGWMVESHGFATGCEGFVTYYPEGYEQHLLKVHFNNPYVGSNKMNTTVGGSGRFTAYTGPIKGGDNCSIIVQFCEYSLTPTRWMDIESRSLTD